MSYHGVPQAYADKGDPYYQQCLDTSKALAAHLQLKQGSYGTSFQSRLGKAPWLQPYTDVTVKQLAKDGVKVLDVICPSFSVDCLETLEEITVENGGYFSEAGGVKLRLVPCLNDAPAHIQMMQTIIQPLLSEPD
jgi:ferrochelatase